MDRTARAAARRVQQLRLSRAAACRTQQLRPRKAALHDSATLMTYTSHVVSYITGNTEPTVEQMKKEKEKTIKT